jgi:hypothetical protein
MMNSRSCSASKIRIDASQLRRPGLEPGPINTGENSMTS